MPVQDQDDNFDEREDIPARLPRVRELALETALPGEIDPGMWFNMVYVKTPYLADLVLESMKKILLDYKHYSQKCPQQLLRRQQLQKLAEKVLILVMLRIHLAKSSRKWRKMIK